MSEVDGGGRVGFPPVRTEHGRRLFTQYGGERIFLVLLFKLGIVCYLRIYYFQLVQRGTFTEGKVTYCRQLRPNRSGIVT